MINELHNVGLLVENIDLSGNFVRCATVDKPNKKNGAYVSIGGGKAIWWTNWASGESGVVPKGKRFNKTEKAEFDAARERAKEEVIERQRKTAERAEKILEKCHLVEESPYLSRKGVLPFNIYQFSKNFIIIPLRDKDGVLWSLQSISPDGNKKFMPNGKKKGCFHKISGDETVLLCEGYATGASLHMATGHTVIVCFDAGNMVNVAQFFPNAIACADNDVENNVGFKAAKATGLRVVMPPAHEGASTDFNDLHIYRGLDAVRSCFKTAEELLTDETFNAILDITDPVLREKALINTRELAKSIGKEKDFDSLLKAYKARRKNGQSRKTAFNDNENLECGHWIADEEGVYTQTIQGDQWATRTPIYPVKRLKNIQSGKEKVTLRYKLERWYEVTFDRSIVASASKVMALSDYGINFTSENSKALVRYFSEIEAWNDIPKLESTSKLGWHNNFKDFLPFSETKIILDSDDCFSGIIDALQPSGNKEEYIEFLKNALSSKRKELCFLFAASLASVLIEPLGGLPFITHLYGQAGRGKTLSTMLAAGVWGNPTDGGYMADPKNTATSFEVNLNFLNNLPFICDDTNKIAKTGQQDFSQFIYLLCSGSGKQRSNVNLGMEKLKRWSNSSITNGEKSIVTETSHGGEILRVIEVEMEEGFLFDDGRGAAEFMRTNYGFFGRMFIEYIMTLGLDAVKQIHKENVDWILSQPNSKEKEGKQIQSMAFVITAATLAASVLEIEPFIDDMEAYNMIKNVNDVSDVRRAYSSMVDIIIQNRAAFKEDFDPMVRWGWLRDDDKTALLFPFQLKELCDKVNVDKKLFIQWGVKEGIIDSSKRIDGTKLFKIHGKCIRLISINISQYE